MTVQHQLEVYIELIANFCVSSAKKVVYVIVSNLLWDQPTSSMVTSTKVIRCVN